MKKYPILLVIAASLFIGFLYFASFSVEENGQNKSVLAHKSDDPLGTSRLDRMMNGKTSGDSEESQSSDRIASKQAHQSMSESSADKNRHPLSETLAQKDSNGLASANGTQNKDLGENGPSIGTVKVLGHRGCDSNTQGWFLSVGTPEQYDFTVSDDGETLEVEPNTPNPSGNFEFIHCADQRQFIGMRVRLTAMIKAQEVTQTAQLRLRGENRQGEAILNEETKVGGTYDWKDFSVETDVGPDVTLFSYGLTFRSAGKLWLSHPVFTVLQ